MQRILERDAGSALMQLGELYGGGKDLTALLGELSDLTRDMMILKTAGKDGADLLTGVYERTGRWRSAAAPRRRVWRHSPQWALVTGS